MGSLVSISLYIYITKHGAWGAPVYPDLLHGGSRPLGAPRDGLWMGCFWEGPQGVSWELKTRRNPVKEASGKCPQLTLCAFSCKKLDSELDPLFTTPNPFWAFATSSFCTYRVSRNTFAERAERVMQKTQEKTRFCTQFDTETSSNIS